MDATGVRARSISAGQKQVCSAQFWIKGRVTQPKVWCPPVFLVFNGSKGCQVGGQRCEHQVKIKNVVLGNSKFIVLSFGSK